MSFEELKPEDRFGTEYAEHGIFEQLALYSDFYELLSFSVGRFISYGTRGLMNIDTYAYSSIKGTIESMRDILKTGRINDAYALLRKYFDVTVTNIYSNIYLSDNNVENFIVKQIDDWVRGIAKMPGYSAMDKYIKNSTKLQPITKLLNKDRRYSEIRNRCNDNIHYNFYRNMLLNDNEIYNPDRISYLCTFSQDIKNIFIQHLGYLFYLNDLYLTSSYYIDCLEIDVQPEEGTQYLVADFVQNIFDTVIKPNRPDIAEEIKANSSMLLK